MYHDAVHSFAHYGVIVKDVKIDWAAMQKQKDTAVSGLTKGIEGLLKKNKVRASAPVTPLLFSLSLSLYSRFDSLASVAEAMPRVGPVCDRHNVLSSYASYVYKCKEGAGCVLCLYSESPHAI